MSIEMSRRRFITLAGFSAAGLLLPESEGLDRPANKRDVIELKEFLRQPIEGREVFRPATSNLLSFVGREKPSEVGFAHNANSLDKIDAFVLDDDEDIAEVDCRVDDKGLYISHNRGRKADIDPITVYHIVTAAPRPKTLKYDIKEPEAFSGILNSIEDNARPCILNADLYGNRRFGISPQQFVDVSEFLPNAIISIGKKADNGNVKEFVAHFIKLATDNPGRDFILPAHLIDFLSSLDVLKEALTAPNISLMVYRTKNFTLTKRHVDWIKENFTDEIRARTFFDL